MTSEVETLQQFGARIRSMSDGTILVQQTVKSGPSRNDRFVIDQSAGKREKFVDADDDEALVQAVRDALAGRLP
jgi:hypothetical protein